ncbi:MAG: sigma-54-dependent Fis family transcriptional regulator [Burkholderiales bacterium]|nr:sigma-54-dependent Fis family transcriptional regulator [Burkholderiales bacterium]
MSAHLLIVDDEPIALANLEHVMARAGYAATAVGSGAAALERLAESEFDLVLTDLRMEGVDGLAVLRAVRARHPDTEVIVITGFATAESAVEAMREGAFYYVAKPYRLDEVRKVVAEALEKRRLTRENAELRTRLSVYEGDAPIVTQSPAILALVETARRVAPTDCNVLVSGETGTGKELFARHVHDASLRAGGPYVAVNCGALSEDLLANELFGHERGAFTGALASKRGLIESADGGTLFLDEVTEMSPAMQVKFLRVLQEREFLRLGGTRPVRADIRVVAATNRDVRGEVEAGRFRSDLYYRLNVVGLDIPPLRERPGDVPLLARHFLRKFAAMMKRPVDTFAPEALDLLESYPFPGNVRELANAIERGVALATGVRVEARDLPAALTEPARDSPAGTFPTLEAVEWRHIRQALDAAGGNQTQAAQMLGIDRVSLWRKLKRHEAKGGA